MSVRMPYAEYVAQDLRAIEARAMALYALSDHELSWPVAWEHVKDKCRGRAKQELWEEGALRFDPTAPYYERTGS